MHAGWLTIEFFSLLHAGLVETLHTFSFVIEYGASILRKSYSGIVHGIGQSEWSA